MIREYVEGHEFNGVKRNNTIFKGYKICIVKGCIRCDGKEQGFAAWGINLKEAQENFNTFLDQDCVCNEDNKLGENPPCSVHKEWAKLHKGGYIK